MTEEEEKAIERLEKAQEDIWFLISYTQKERQEDTRTVLNLVQKQQAEIEKKDKIINLMIKQINENIYRDEETGCEFELKKEVYCNENCEKCIKQYYERKVENGD